MFRLFSKSQINFYKDLAEYMNFSIYKEILTNIFYYLLHNHHLE